MSASLKLLTLLFLSALCLRADMNLPSIFGDHMVLQQQQKNPVWGTADPGEKVVVSIAGQSHEAVASADGHWRVVLDPMNASFEPKVLEVSGLDSQVAFADVLVGEVWFCSGQSNMAWNVASSYDADLVKLSANNPHIRFFRVPLEGSGEPQFDFEANWEVCSSKTVAGFSAVGYFFGRGLYQTLNVPIGLVNNAWGGSPIESWIPRDALDAAGDYAGILEYWDQRSATYSDSVYAQELADFDAWEAAGRPAPKRWRPDDIRIGRHRPSNIWNGMVSPTVGYGLRGVIWYQGESNLGNPRLYQTSFPLLIHTLRERWGQGDFPFYWAQLADHTPELSKPGKSGWAELREAQSMTLSVVNTGEAITIDTGEERDIHPRDKETVSKRLLRHALKNDYGYNIHADSPRFSSMQIDGHSVIITFDHVKHGLYAFDTEEIHGFSIVGADGNHVWAKAEIVDWNTVRVWSDEVVAPVAVRYAWANNPVVNLYDRLGLPVAPFRTDN
ncbi:MAG: sialate O-acetylesterase [Lentimonas sp.]